MIDLVKNFFGRRTDSREERVHDIRVATCALLMEMSKIDGDFSDEERKGILEALRDDYGVSEDVAASLIEAADDELKGSRDLWEFTTLINKNYSPEEKKSIIEMVWRIAYSDGRLDKNEDFLVHKLANLLHLQHRELIDSKLKVMKELGIEVRSR